MVTFLLVFLAIAALILVLAYKFRNPYKLTMVFGKKGSGKTTFLTKKAIQYMRKGRTVYSTVYVPGAHFFDVQQIGHCTFPPESVVFIDEVGMIWDNRNFKNFRTDVRDWFKLQRHYHVTVYLFSQTFDIDVKLRNLTDQMYLCTSHMGFLSIARKIKRSIVLVQPSGESESRIADSLEFVPLWYSLFGAKSAIFTYIPNWVRYFDSYEAPSLPLIGSEFQAVPEDLLPYFKGKKIEILLMGMRSVATVLKAKRPAALARGVLQKERKVKEKRSKKKSNTENVNGNVQVEDLTENRTFFEEFPEDFPYT